MKKIFFLVAVYSFSASKILSQIHQDKISENGSKNFDVVIQSNNQLSRVGFSNDIKAAAMRDFIKSFEDATNVMWRIADDGCSVNFNYKNEKLTSYYNKLGDHIFTTKTYTRSELDPVIARLVKNQAGEDFSIYLVTETIRANNTTYEISLQNNSQWCIVKLIKRGRGEIEKLSENIYLQKG